MKQYYSNVIQYRGTHYDFGYFQGEQLRESPILPNREKDLERRKNRHYIVNPEEYINIMSKYSPAILDEIYGLADALDMEMKKAFQLFGGYYLEYTRSGCSIFTDSDFMVRNYDSHPRGYEGRYTFYEPTDHGYAVIGPSMRIAGRIDGMNEKGLVMGYNFTHSKNSGDGFLCSMIGRLILETCANVDEAVSLLEDIPHRHSFSYIILDPEGVSYVVEASPRRVAVRQSNVCTNHFHLLDEENRYRQEETRERERTIQAEQQHATNPYQAFKVMNNPDHGIFSHKYDASAGTIHTSVYFPKELKAWFVIGPDKQPVIFDFSKWLRGNNVNVKQIKGTLEYDRPFVNMER
ncbi:acyl-CoA--6-aminopenicillanic acid acyltransferase [Salinicoccus sp. ID82-1]|uniref:C45 family autoproteolytic acyltransferase/hydolase n=1 Tax=Salinicoccus sp. ID82-1 TaxID=2820269 RepID=UPI001F1F3F7A|nr:C45 family peptidase [Salinicoccus sp. ID82-1]MCG1010714.1 acyl-CoA--6-aminopenicillanic acid acyltransferase [Salinicoccus sp. ID82-1]